VTVSVDDLTAKIDAGEPLSDQDIAALGSSRDIIILGMLATTVRHRLHGNEVTYVRVADLSLGPATELVPNTVPDAAGEVRIFQTPKTLDAAVAIVEKASDLAGGVPLSAFCLFELGKLPEGCPSCFRRYEKPVSRPSRKRPSIAFPLQSARSKRWRMRDCSWHD